jgi:hypothetical protein
MLEALPKVLKPQSPVWASHNALMVKLKTTTVPEYNRRVKTGRVVYQLNFIIAVSMRDASGAKLAEVTRVQRWTSLTRQPRQTAQEWREDVTLMGLTQDPPIQVNTEQFNLKFISGSNLPRQSGKADTLAIFEISCNCAGTDPCTLTTDRLEKGLAYQLRMDGDRKEVTPGVRQDAAWALEMGKKNPSPQPKVVHNTTASKKAQASLELEQHNHAGSAKQKATKEPAREFKGRCFVCNEPGHRAVDCPDKTRQDNTQPAKRPKTEAPKGTSSKVGAIRSAHKRDHDALEEKSTSSGEVDVTSVAAINKKLNMIIASLGSSADTSTLKGKKGATSSTSTAHW